MVMIRCDIAFVTRKVCHVVLPKSIVRDCSSRMLPSFGAGEAVIIEGVYDSGEYK
jgi:hypothetical protein